MPPLNEDEDANGNLFVDSDSDNEIPAKKPPKKSAEEDEVMEDAGEDDQEGSGSEQEYSVERIKSHKTKGKKGNNLVYEVKWSGFDESENTWEPEDNLENAKELIAAYWKKLGGRPGATNGEASKKRRASQGPAAASESTSKGAAKKARQSLPADIKKQAKSEAGPDGVVRTAKRVFPEGSWEEIIDSIETLEQNESKITGQNELWASVKYCDGKDPWTGRLQVEKLKIKAPQKLLDYLLAHLSFNNNTAEGPQAI